MPDDPAHNRHYVRSVIARLGVHKCRYVRVSSGSAWKAEEPDQRYFARRRLMSFMMVSATTALTEDTTQIRNHKTTMRPVTVIPTALAEAVRSISVNTRTD